MKLDYFIFLSHMPFPPQESLERLQASAMFWEPEAATAANLLCRELVIKGIALALGNCFQAHGC